MSSVTSSDLQYFFSPSLSINSCYSFNSLNLTLTVFHSLFDFLGSEVQKSAADPLNLKPVLEVVVATTAKLNLQTIDGLFLKTAARHVCVLVEADTISQAHLTAKRENLVGFAVML